MVVDIIALAPNGSRLSATEDEGAFRDQKRSPAFTVSFKVSDVGADTVIHGMGCICAAHRKKGWPGTG